MIPETNHIYPGDAISRLRSWPENFIDCCVTSPPYWGLRSYLPKDSPQKIYELGMEPTPEEYVAKMVALFREVRRCLRPDGTLWLNIGDSYIRRKVGAQGKTVQRAGRREVSMPQMDLRQSGLKEKDLAGIPWRLALALQADGWWLRSDIVWSKSNTIPESVRDRPTRAHEYLFLLAKSEKYYYDYKAVKEPCKSGKNDLKRMATGMARLGGKGIGHEDEFCASTARTKIHKQRSVGSPEGRNMRSVWHLSTSSYRGAHFATFPEKLIMPCVKAGSREGGIILDPFSGAGTTALVAKKLGRKYIGIELNEEYIRLSNERISTECGDLI